GLFFEYLGNDNQIVKLKCQVGQYINGGETMSITISNLTSKENLAYVSRGGNAEIGKQYLNGKVFIAGSISAETGYHPAHLDVMLIEYDQYIDQAFGCNVLWMKSGNTKMTEYTIQINKTVDTTARTTTTHATFTDAPYRVAPVKDKEVEAESLPMSVLIVMLVLISILLFLAVFLLLHRYKSKCQRRDEDMYRPPAYCMAPEHHHLDWTDSSIKSKSSARTINSRSHYSIAAHHMHMPLPPIPHSPRRTRILSQEETVPIQPYECRPGIRKISARNHNRNSAYRRPPSVVSSVKVPYVQPQDAIGQESSEDGEIAALSSGSPKVHYNTRRDGMTRQNSPLYACVPVSSTDE
ncbi:hypothetical protein Bpfe_016228, partial [Biomphalaria pfeifferi]